MIYIFNLNALISLYVAMAPAAPSAPFSNTKFCLNPIKDCS